RASPRGSSRTTRAVGSITVMSSRTRTPGWRAGTWSTRRRGEVHLRISLLVVALALLIPGVASAQTYPEPKDPGPVAAPPKGPHKTHTVCKKGCDFRSI